MEFGLRWHTGGGGFFGDLGVRTAGRKIVTILPDGMTSFGYGDNETLVAHGKTVLSACRDLSAVTCVDAGPGAVAGGSVSYSDTGLAPGVANHWVFVMTSNVTKKFQAQGWALHRLATAVRIVDDTQADTYEVNALAHSASIFTDASQAGDSGGSIAQAVPPCSNAEVTPVREGVGQFTLDGGVQQQQMTCPGLVIGQAIGSWAPGRTTWHAYGKVVGASTLYTARLMVLGTPPMWTPARHP